MTTEPEDTRIVRSWLEEGVTALPDRVLDTVLDQLPATPQRRVRRPAWRSITMSTPIRLVATAAAIGALSVAIGIAPGTTGPGTTDLVASPPPSSTVGADWAFFAGTVDRAGETVAGPTEQYADDGLSVSLGYRFGTKTMVADDPRMTGTRMDLINLFSDAPENSQGDVGSALVTISTDQGAWTCPMTLIHVVSRSEGELSQQSGWCDGAGAYEDLKAYVTFHGEDDVFYGFITAGDAPPMPDAPAS